MYMSYTMTDYLVRVLCIIIAHTSLRTEKFRTVLLYMLCGLFYPTDRANYEYNDIVTPPQSLSLSLYLPFLSLSAEKWHIFNRNVIGTKRSKTESQCLWLLWSRSGSGVGRVGLGIGWKLLIFFLMWFLLFCHRRTLFSPLPEKLRYSIYACSVRGWQKINK